MGDTVISSQGIWQRFHFGPALNYYWQRSKGIKAACGRYVRHKQPNGHGHELSKAYIGALKYKTFQHIPKLSFSPGNMQTIWENVKILQMFQHPDLFSIQKLSRVSWNCQEHPFPDNKNGIHKVYGINFPCSLESIRTLSRLTKTFQSIWTLSSFQTFQSNQTISMPSWIYPGTFKRN